MGAILVGFSGVVYVAQPTSDVFNPAILFVIGSSLSYSFLMLASRWLGKTEPTFTIVFYVNVGTASLAALAMPYVWKDMSFLDFGVIGLMAVLSLAGNICIVKAFMIGEIGVITPFEYTGLLWAVLLGFIFFQETPNINVWVGIAIIAASGLYLVYRENRKRPDQS
ncbi:MAG: DMT family transporter [Sneathiella sp.]|nr:DMT family transporter [Sneathiella sp.]